MELCVQEADLRRGWGGRGSQEQLEEKMQPTAVFLPGESHGQRSLVGHSPKVTMSWIQLSN